MDVLEVIDKTSWRLGLLRRKALGCSPEIEWNEIVLAIMPERLWHGRRSALDRVPPCDRSVQIARRDGAMVLWRTRLGPIWGRETDGPAILNLSHAILDERVYNRAPAGIGEDDVVIDAGAHLGAFTRFALRHFEVKKLIAFEPDPGLAECYRRTFEAEIRGGSVVLIEAAAWRRKERILLPLPPIRHVEGRRHARKDSVEVQAVTIDETLARLGIGDIGYMKINVGGAERHVLAGATETLRRSRPRMTVCNSHQRDDVPVLREIVAAAQPEYEVIRRRDYDYYYCGEGCDGREYWELGLEPEDRPSFSA